MVIKGKFADGSPMIAIPNYARTNRDKELPLEGALPLGADGAVRPARVRRRRSSGFGRADPWTLQYVRLPNRHRRLKEAWRRNT